MIAFSVSAAFYVLDIFLRLRVNLLTGSIVATDRFIVDGLGRLQVIQSELDGNGEIAYLFADEEGSIYYGPPDLEPTRRAGFEREVCVVDRTE